MSDRKSSVKDERTRNWTAIVYPESAPENWQSIVDGEHVQWVESPLHEGEINPDSEAEKKTHKHILLLYAGNKSYEQVKELTDKLNATIPQKCRNAKGLVRYFVHMDNPEKKQYNVSDIVGHGGADVSGYLKATGSARYELIGEMLDFVTANGVTEMIDLLNYARVERFEDWFPLLCDNSAYIMSEAVKSNRFRESKTPRKVDKETGEVLD